MVIRSSSSSGIPYGNTAGRPTAATGQPYFNGEAQRLELYTGTSWENIVQTAPAVASVSGTYLESANSGVITITGTNFVSGATASAVGFNGVQVDAASTTFNSVVQLTATFTGLLNAQEPYDIKVTNPSTLFGQLVDILYINANPVWTTAAGSLGAFGDNVSISVSATATDESAITYALASGSTLPSGVTLNSATGLISGTLPDISSDTTYSFTINASDGVNPAVPRAFSFTSNAAPVWVTAAGSLGTFLSQASISVSVTATDSGTLTYSLASGSTLPSGVTLNSATGLISGTLPVISADITYSFTINASDGTNTVPRSFSILHEILRTGASSATAAPSPKYLKSYGYNTSGLYWFKNSGYNSGAPFQAFADMSVGDGYIITSGNLMNSSEVTNYSIFGTAPSTSSGSPGYSLDFYLPTASILTGWSGDTNNRFIVGMTNRSGTDIGSSSAKHWFVLNLSPSVAKTWFDNTPGQGEYTFASGGAVASSSGTIPNNGAVYYRSSHGNGVIQLSATAVNSVNESLWMELHDTSVDANHTASVWGSGNGTYAAAGAVPIPFWTRWMFMGFSPGNLT